MRTDTKKFAVLYFIAINSPQGVRACDIARKICELSGYDYDQKDLVHVWDYKLGAAKKVMRRRHASIWGTNLYYGRNSILKKYCHKNGKFWVIDAEYKNEIIEGANKQFSRPNKKASLADTISKLDKQNFKSDTIEGNSVPVSVRHVQIPSSAHPFPSPSLMAALHSLPPIVEKLSLTQMAKKFEDLKAQEEAALNALDDAQVKFDQVQEAKSKLALDMWAALGV